MGVQFEILISSDAVARRTQELGTRIRADYSNEPILLVGILKGSFILLGDIARAIGEFEVDFAQISRTPFTPSARSSAIRRRRM